MISKVSTDRSGLQGNSVHYLKEEEIGKADFLHQSVILL